jgi:DNA-binding SARP family transcriptional activator
VDERVVVHLFGPVRLSVGEQTVAPGGPRERAVLAALVTATSNRASVDRLIDWLWDDEPPTSARKSIQNAVMLLRRTVGPAGLQIGRDADSYELTLGRAEVDFDGLDGDPPLAGISDTTMVVSARVRLNELRLAAMERRLRERLAIDAHGVAADVEPLVSEHPLRESLWSILITALYRAGAQSEALDTYQRARRALIEGAGVEPGPQLRQLEHDILAQDPGLVGAPEDRARGLLAEGRTRGRAGDSGGARALLDQAVVAARASGDHGVLGDVACALAGEAQWLIGDAALEALLEEARAQLGSPPRDLSRAARLDAGLALLRATRGDQRAKVHGSQGVALIDDSLSREDRTAALFAQAIAWEGPDDVDARLRNGDALLEHGRLTGDLVAVAFGHQYRGWALLERGEFAASAAERAAALRAGETCDHPHLAAQMADTAFLTALLDGDVVAATALTAEIASTWHRSADRGMAWAVDVGCRLFLGELTTGLDPLLPEITAAASAMPGEVLWTVAAALAHAVAGRSEQARAMLDALSPSRLRDIPRSTIWTANLSGLASTAALCGHRETAAAVRDLLQPIANLQIVCGWLVYRGSVAYWLGRCEQTLGRLDDAINVLRQGLLHHRSASSPPWIALGSIALAEALLDRDAPHDRQETQELLRDAHIIAASCGMDLAVATCVTLTNRLRQARTGPQS